MVLRKTPPTPRVAGLSRRARHPGVGEGVAVAGDAASGEAGDGRLRACGVIDEAGPAAGGEAAAVPGAAPAPAPEPLARALRQALRGTLPGSMVPADFVVWD